MPPLYLIVPFVGRYLLRHPAVSILSILSVALGVSVFLAVRVANHSADAAFRAGIDLVSGKSHLEVRATAGELDEEIFPLVEQVAGVAAATPIVEGYATLPDHPGEFLHLIGVDVFSNLPFQTAELTQTASPLSDPVRWLGTANQVILDQRFAKRLELAAGETLRVLINGESRNLQVAHLREGGTGPAVAPDNVAAMDLGWMQELLDSSGGLSSIQVLAEDPDGQAALASALAAVLPKGVSVATPSQRSKQVGLMLRGFKLNLTAMSMVAALVGVFLVYNAVAASAVRRRGEIATLRALGLDRSAARGLFLSEAGLLGLLGVILGLPLGILLAGTLLGGVTQAISAHYITIKAGALVVAPGDVLLATLFGLTAAFVGAWIPAGEAAKSDPAAALRGPAKEGGGSSRDLARALLGVLFLMIAAAAGWVALQGRFPEFSFLSCFFVVGGFALAVPLCARHLTGIVLKLPAPPPWGLACQGLVRSLHRNGMTIAALMAAVSMAVGVTTMVYSFRKEVGTWVDQVLRADLYVAPSANTVIGQRTFLPPEVRAFLLAHEDVETTATYREMPAVSEDGRPFSIGASAGRASLRPLGKEQDVPAMLERWRSGDFCFVNEPFSNKFDVAAGDRVALPTPDGLRDFEVIAVYRDYTKDGGQVILSQSIFERYWEDTRVNSVAAFLNEGADVDQMIADLKAAHGANGELAIFSNRSIRKQVYDIFDQTFAVTYVLRAIAVAVAGVGVILGLTTLVRERTRQIGVLRAVGASRGQIMATYLSEAGLIGLWSALLGIVCGLVLAAVLTWVVNPAFFGWTIAMSIPWIEIVTAPLWVVTAAILAGIWPALQAANTPSAAAVREE